MNLYLTTVRSLVSVFLVFHGKVFPTVSSYWLLMHNPFKPSWTVQRVCVFVYLCLCMSVCVCILYFTWDRLYLSIFGVLSLFKAPVANIRESEMNKQEVLIPLQ